MNKENLNPIITENRPTSDTNQNMEEGDNISFTKEKYDFNLETFTKAIGDFYKEKEFDETIEPDISIYEDEQTFTVTINGRLRTGRGGLRMYLDNFDSIDFMKVSYNEIVLNKEQKQELFNNVKNGK